MGVACPSQLRKLLPPTLAALIAGTLLSILWLSDTSVIGEVPTGLPELSLPPFSVDGVARAVQPALIIALLGSIDSLLTSLIADSMTRTRHDPNRELVGQGIGNTLAGFIGGLPGAGATMGTVVKHSGPEELAVAIRDLAQGKLRIPDRHIRRVFAIIRGQRGLGAGLGLRSITDREKEILRLFAEGKSYAQIAEARGNKASTMKNAIYRIQEKLGVESKQEIVVWAVRNGLLDDMEQAG